MKRLLLGISSGILYTILSIGVSLLTAPYFLKFLSREEFGIFYLANNLIVWTGLLNAGLRGSFKLQLAAALGKSEETEQLATTSFLTQCLIALIVSLVGFVMSFFLTSALGLSSALSSDVRFIFIVLSFSFAFSLISNSLAAILSVHNRDLNVYTAKLILTSLQAMLSIVLLYFGWGIRGLSVAALLSEISFLCYMFFLVKSKFHFASFHFSFFDRKLLLSSLSMGKWFLAGFLAQLLIRHTDLLLIGKLAGMDKVAAFIISSKLYLLASALLQMIIKIATPQLIRLMQSQGTTDFSTKMIMLFLKFVIGFTIICGTGIYLFNETFIRWWVGNSFYLGGEINLLLLLAFLFTSFNLAARALLAAKMQLQPQKISALAEGSLHLVLSALFGFFYGLQGIAAGIALSSAAACFISFPFFLKDTELVLTRKDITAILCYMLITLLILLIVPSSPSFGKGLFAVAAIAGTFILLFLKDLRMITVKILSTN